MKVYRGQVLNARGEQFREPQDGPKGHYRLGVPPLKSYWIYKNETILYNVTLKKHTVLKCFISATR